MPIPGKTQLPKKGPTSLLTKQTRNPFLTIYSFHARPREQMQDIPFSLMNT